MSKIKWKINEASHQLRSGGFWAASPAVCINSIPFHAAAGPKGYRIPVEGACIDRNAAAPGIIIFILKRFPNAFNWAAWGIIASASGILCKINNGVATIAARGGKTFPRSGWLARFHSTAEPKIIKSILASVK